MNATFTAKSTEGDGYLVQLDEVGDSLRIFCHCPAGKSKRWCKHARALSLLDASMLRDPEQSPALAAVAAWPLYPALRTVLDEKLAILDEIERQTEELNARSKVLKAALIRRIHLGI